MRVSEYDIQAALLLLLVEAAWPKGGLLADNEFLLIGALKRVEGPTADHNAFTPFSTDLSEVHHPRAE